MTSPQLPIRWVIHPPSIIRPPIHPRGRDGVPALLAANELIPGDRLLWTQPRRGVTHFAVVAADGTLVVGGVPCSSPQEAANLARGSATGNAWWLWRCQRTGELIGAMRERLASYQQA